MRKSSSIAQVLGAFLLIISLPTGFAAEEDMPYAQRWTHRIIRGTSNIALGWFEIFLRPIDEKGRVPFWQSVSNGLSNTGVRVVGGTLDVAGFWLSELPAESFYPPDEMWPYIFSHSRLGSSTPQKKPAHRPFFHLPGFMRKNFIGRGFSRFRIGSAKPPKPYFETDPGTFQ